jgi:diguanylate cyclase (GGDEF)-like protein
VQYGVVVADQCFTGRPVTEGDTSVLAMLCSALGLAIENVALDAQSRKLRALAEKDELTGINNRRNILVVLQREIDRARRYGKPLSLAMVDVDHFKDWNDLHGHQIGDKVLQSVVQLVSHCSRDIDECGRYGGEEFLIVLPETPADHAVLYAERLRIAVESHGEALRATYPSSSLSVSIGVSSLSPRGDDADRMIHRADQALYAAKRHGRNRVCVEAAATAEPQRTPAPPARGVMEEL